MTQNQVMVVLQARLGDILLAKGLQPVAMSPETDLLGGNIPIDSLDLAQLVLELQSHTKKDPFANGFVGFETVGQLTQLFAN